MEKADKNEREKTFLYEYAIKNASDRQFMTIEQERESYFLKRDEDLDKKPYLKIYGFETLPELMEELDLMWETEDFPELLRKTIGVAAMKNKTTDEKTAAYEKKIKTKDEDRLPEFIYNF